MLICPEGVSVKTLESILGAYPDKAQGILNNGAYAGIGKALLYRKMLELCVL